MRQDDTTAARAASFGAVARDYDRLRAQPPAEALDWLLPEGAEDVLELGAGTGLLTTVLARRVRRVIAVEPDTRMGAVLVEKAGAARDHAGFRVVAGRAEEIPLPGASVDVVIAQSAWHWVDEELAVPEVARVLRRGGRFSLAWTGTDRSVDWMRTLWAGGVERTPRPRRIRQSRSRSVGGATRCISTPVAAAAFTEPETAFFRWTQPMKRSDLVALAGTYSAVIAMDAATRRQHLAGMERYLEPSAWTAWTASPGTTSSTCPCGPIAGAPSGAEEPPAAFPCVAHDPGHQKDSTRPRSAPSHLARARISRSDRQACDKGPSSRGRSRRSFTAWSSLRCSEP